MRPPAIVAFAAVLGAITATPAAAQGPLPAPDASTGPSTAIERPSARFSWSMPARYQRGWRAWDPATARYDRAYVQPQRWAVNINACASSGGSAPITSYEITLTGVGIEHQQRRSGTACRYRLRGLPQLGSYDVSVLVRTARGTSVPRTERVTLRDHLIVSLGDSLASGEGVPDEPGIYTPPFTLTQSHATLRRVLDKSFRPVTVRAARWQDRRCHRSARSGHARAARAIEQRDPKTSVTFVSLACSGATIADVLDTRYAGIQPTRGATDLPPQLDALRALVRAQDGRRGRTVDAVLLSIGINDLGFSGIVESCAANPKTLASRPWGDKRCVYGGGVNRMISVGGELEQRYAELAGALGDRLDVTDVYITDYPGRPFGHARGGCGLLGIPGIGITGAEAAAMAQVGEAYVWTIGRAAAANAWNWINGMTEAFGPHHYCSGDPWLNRLESSIIRQGTVHGAVHPNRTGHAAYGAMLAKSIVLRPPSGHWRARLVVESVRVDAGLTRAATVQRERDDTGEPLPPPPADEYGFDFGVRTMPSWPGRVSRRFQMPLSRTGEWVPVPAEVGVFELDVYDPPRPPRYATGVDFLTRGPGGTLGGWHPYAEGFGAGCHEVRHGTGWALRYRVEVHTAGTPAASPARPLQTGVGCLHAAER